MIILALLVAAAGWIVLVVGDEPVLATHVRAVDVGVQDARSGHDNRTARTTRPRTATQAGQPTKSGQVDTVEVIGLMMMLGAPRGR